MSVQTIDPKAELDALPIDYKAVLNYLGLRGNDVKAQAVVLVCQRYDLDPVLKHVVLVDGNVYVTRDGLLHVAHSTGQFDGIEVAEAALVEDEWRSRATVWRKDMSHGITFSGRYPKGRKNSPEMAEKVAVARALKHAFDVAIATEDERQAQEAIKSPTGGLEQALNARTETEWPEVTPPAEPEAAVDAELVEETP